MSDDNQSILRRTAIHEAGHVVAAMHFRHLIGDVSIIVDPDLGRLGFSASEDSHDPDEQVIVLYAGLAAERLIRPETQVEEGSWDDYERASQVHGLDAPPPHLEQAAANLVAERRSAIEALAQALIERQTLKGDEAALVVDCVDEGSDWQQSLSELLTFKSGA